MAKIGYVKYLGNGKYLLRLSLGFDEFGKRIQPSRTIEADSDRQAEKALMDFYAEREKLRQQRVRNDPQTLGALHTEWETRHVKESLRPATAEYYRFMWGKHLKPFEKAKLKTFSPAMVSKILGSETMKDSPRTRKGIYRMLSAMFNWAIKQPYMKSNPCDAVDVPEYKAKKKPVYTEEEIAAIIRIVEAEEPEFQAIFYFAVLCGMRKEEIIGLPWANIDFDGHTFVISQVATCAKGKGTFIDSHTKNLSSARQLELPETLIPILKAIRAKQTERRLKLGDKWEDGGYVFTRWNGKLMGIHTPDQWRARMKREHPEFPRKDLHTLRHTFATYQITAGTPISAVSGALGHAQQSTTLNIYSEVIEKAKTAAISSQEKIITEIGQKNKRVQ